MNTENWLHTMEIIGFSVGIVNLNYYSTVEVGVSDVWKEETENKNGHWQEKEKTVNEEEPSTNETFTLCYLRILLLFRIHLLPT